MSYMYYEKLCLHNCTHVPHLLFTQNYFARTSYEFIELLWYIQMISFIMALQKSHVAGDVVLVLVVLLCIKTCLFI